MEEEQQRSGIEHKFRFFLNIPTAYNFVLLGFSQHETH